MPYTPSLCGGFLTDKRSMVAFTWSITTVLTLFAFITAVILTIQVHTHYRRMERYYEGDDWYQDSQYYNNNNNGNGGGEGEEEEQQQQRNSHDEEYFNQVRESYVLLSTMSARSITFVAVYTMFLSTGLSLYGSMAIVGFTSLRGVYIAPCFSSGNDKLQVGVFGGAIVLFANLLLVCAVILGEVKVADYRDRGEDEQQQAQEEREPYQVERIATILAVACMFLSALYTIFAVLLFLCHAGEEGSSFLLGEPTSTKMSMMMMENVGVGVGVGGVLQSESDGNGDHSNSSPLVVNVNGASGVNGMGGNSHLDYRNMQHRPMQHLPMHHHQQQQYHQMHHQIQQMQGHTMTSVHPGHTMVTHSPGFITMDNSSQGTSE